MGRALRIPDAPIERWQVWGVLTAFVAISVVWGVLWNGYDYVSFQSAFRAIPHDGKVRICGGMVHASRFEETHGVVMLQFLTQGHASSPPVYLDKSGWIRTGSPPFVEERRSTEVMRLIIDCHNNWTSAVTAEGS